MESKREAVEFACTVFKPRALKRCAVAVAATPGGVFRVEFKACPSSLARIRAEVERARGRDGASARALPGSIGSQDGIRKSRAFVKKAVGELEAYLEGKLQHFSVPLDRRVFSGRSAFDGKVWRAMLRVPYGRVTTYGNLARAVSRPGASRAVGGAVGRNPVPILIPCHRVVGSGGRLTGFSSGLAIKEILLGIEGLRLTAAKRAEDRRVLHGRARIKT